MLVGAVVGWNLPSSSASLKYVGGYAYGWVGTASNTTISLTSLVGGIGSAPQIGDLVVVALAVRGTTDINLALVTSGYTELADLFGSDSACTNLGVYRKLMSGSPDTAVVVGSTSAGDCALLAVHVWRGADQTTPIDVTTTIAVASNGNLPDSPSITPVTAGAIVLALGASTSNTATTGYGSAMDNLVTSNDPTNELGIGIASHPWGAGAYNPPTFTHAWGGSASFHAWAAASVVIRPA